MSLGSSDGDKIRSPVLLDPNSSTHCKWVSLSPFLGFDLGGNHVVSWSDGEL